MDLTKKLVSIFLVLLLGFSVMTPITKASNHVTTNFEIIDVEVDGESIFSAIGPTATISVERDSTVEVEVTIKGIDATSGVDIAKDVRVDAEIKGYEFGDIEDKTDFFDVKENVTYVKRLSLQIPDDIDANEDFNLVIEVSDRKETATFEADVHVASARHDLNILDVIFKSGSVIKAGNSLLVDVWVENLGDRSEDDVAVTISIPELGLSTRERLTELVSEEEDEDSDDDDEDDTKVARLILKIPESTQTGDYDVITQVEFNKGRNVERETSVLSVEGVTREAVPGVDVILTVDTTSQSVAQGEGAVYKVTVANLAKTAKTFSIDVTGTALWATSRVDPAVLTVTPGDSGEMFVFVSANENAALGKHIFTAKVMADSTLVKEITLEADVTQAAATRAGASWEQVRRGLEIGFAVLLIILVILGIIIAIGKIRRPGEGVEEEPTTAEGQSYYYYPRY